ncbi:hypothetical protein DL98DRAFT_583034 [Cadophora sp. DSE1049]|nr:hypothetical protein DL98DRAFT_583034 [Cadophora sp. DSE1049]
MRAAEERQKTSPARLTRLTSTPKVRIEEHSSGLCLPSALQKYLALASWVLLLLALAPSFLHGLILWGFLSSAKLSVADNAICGSLSPVQDYRHVRTVLFSQRDLKDAIDFSSSDFCLLTDVIVGWTCGGRKCHISRQSQFSRSIKLHLHTEEDDDSGIPVKFDGDFNIQQVASRAYITRYFGSCLCQPAVCRNLSHKYCPFVIETMKQQLARCLGTHGSDCPSRFDVGLPSRVIDVDSDDNSERLSLHNRNLRERGQYAALSYCWGEHPHPFTPTTDLIRYPSRRNWSQLLTTIRDAIWVTRALGLRY